MKVAQNAGARNLLVTAQPQRARPARRFMLHIPAQTMAAIRAETTSVLPMGSAYEGTLFVLFEIMVLKLKALLDGVD